MDRVLMLDLSEAGREAITHYYEVSRPPSPAV